MGISNPGYVVYIIYGCIGKLFHKVLAKRLQSYHINIGISLQKGFISGMNGVMEHNYYSSVNALINNAGIHKLSLATTFVDLCNAFGSISHQYLLNMLSLVRLPSNVYDYIKDMYSKLRTYFATKTGLPVQWK
jgi:short-subunit dehydrogenase involved in D-alanine esterification of teichoic acids